MYTFLSRDSTYLDTSKLIQWIVFKRKGFYIKTKNKCEDLDDIFINIIYIEYVVTLFKLFVY